MIVDTLLLLVILLVFVCLILTVLFFLWRCGLFHEIDIKSCAPPFGQLEVAYKFVRGSSSDCGRLFTEAHSLAPHLRCIGIHYDEVPEGGSQRYAVGLVLNDTEQEVGEEERQRIQAEGFQTTTFPAVEHVVYTTFPHLGVVSVLIALHRVVPQFKEYVRRNRLQAYPLMELYGSEEIAYVAPLSNQSEFFVYEALAESEEEPTSEQQTVDDLSSRELEELPDTISSVEESASRIEELPSHDDSLEDRNKSNGSEASTESFEELQLDA